MKKKAILYAAKSTADKRESIPTQLTDGHEFADEENMLVVGQYQDEDASAYHGDRGPGLAEALEHAERESAVLIVQHSDRLARGDGLEARHLAELWFHCRRRGVEIRSVQDDSTWTHPLMVVAMGERNTEDSRRKGAAVDAGMRRRARRGLWTGTRRPFGYDLKKTLEDGAPVTRLVVNEREAVIVRRVFAEVIAGKTQLGISRRLSAERVPTVQGGIWRPGAIRQMVKNPLYRGAVRYSDEEHPGQHEAIVDEETWRRAGDLMATRANSPGGPRGRSPVGRHLFTRGLLRCVCGGAMVPRTQPNRRKPNREVYMCHNRFMDPTICDVKPIERSEIDRPVFEYFSRLALDIEGTRDQLAREQGMAASESRTLLGAAEREASSASARLARVRRDYVDGEISAADWSEFRDELTAEREAAEREAERLKAKITEQEAIASMGDLEADSLRRLAALRAAVSGAMGGNGDIEALRAALFLTFDRFEMRRLPDQPVPADLAWGPSNFVIAPVVREEAMDGVTEYGRVRVRRKTLNLEPKTIDVSACLAAISFAPIPIGAES